MAAVLDGISTQAITEAAKRFVAGEVRDQSLRFAPSVPEFVREARNRQAIIDSASRPRIEQQDADEFTGERVAPEKMQALHDAWAGKRTIQSVADEFGIKLAGE